MRLAALINLPSAISTKPKAMDAELGQRPNTARLNDEWFTMIGGENDESVNRAGQTGSYWSARS